MTIHTYIQFTPLPLTSYLPSSFLHLQPQFPPSLSMPACRLHVARGLTSHLILGFGVGKVSSFQPPQPLTVSTAGCSPQNLLSLSINRAKEYRHYPSTCQSFSPGHLNTEKNIPALALASRERDGFHTQPQPPTGRRKLLPAIRHKHSTSSHKTPPTPLQSPPLPNTHRATPALNTLKQTQTLFVYQPSNLPNCLPNHRPLQIHTPPIIHATAKKQIKQRKTHYYTHHTSGARSRNLSNTEPQRLFPRRPPYHGRLAPSRTKPQPNPALAPSRVLFFSYR